MTPSTRPTSRVTSAYWREKGKLRPLIVTVIGSIVEVRAKGLRSTETMDVAAIYSFAIKSRLARQKAERKALKRKKP